MTERRQKWNAFLADDLVNNNGLILKQLFEIRNIMNEPLEYEAIKEFYLKKILEYTVSESKFYSNYKHFKSIKDFPVVNKNILRDNWNDVFVERYKVKKDIKERHTSGSTGTPFQLYWDHEKHCRMIADIKYCAELGDIKSHERIVVCSTAQGHEANNPQKERRDNVFGCFFKNCSFEEIEVVLNRIRDFNAKCIISQAFFLDSIARFLMQKPSFCRDGFKISTIFSEGQLLKNKTREVLSNFFGCKVFSRYGNMECGPLAQEDGSNRGQLINEASYYIEILAIDSDNEVEDGIPGRVIVTDLYNKAFPLIRYDTGDIAIRKQYSDGKVYLSDIIGRTSDLIYSTSGDIVPYANLINNWICLSGINQIQIIQNSTVDYKILLNSKNNDHDSKIKNDCIDTLGKDANITIEHVVEIPQLRSGKTRVAVCNLEINRT